MMKPYTEVRLLTLLPHVKEIFVQLLKACYAEGIDVQVSCGYRSPEQQDALYEQGRSRPGAIITNARGGQSSHQKRIAVDLFFLSPKGKADFSDKLYSRVWEIAKEKGLDKYGLSWSGNWNGKFKEKAHFEIKA